MIDCWHTTVPELLPERLDHRVGEVHGDLRDRVGDRQ